MSEVFYMVKDSIFHEIFFSWSLSHNFEEDVGTYQVLPEKKSFLNGLKIRIGYDSLQDMLSGQTFSVKADVTRLYAHIRRFCIESLNRTMFQVPLRIWKKCQKTFRAACLKGTAFQAKICIFTL